MYKRAAHHRLKSLKLPHKPDACIQQNYLPANTAGFRGICIWLEHSNIGQADVRPNELRDFRGFCQHAIQVLERRAKLLCLVRERIERVGFSLP